MTPSSAIPERAGLEADMSVALQVHEGGITLRSVRKKYSLDDLLTGNFQQVDDRSEEVV